LNSMMSQANKEYMSLRMDNDGINKKINIAFIRIFLCLTLKAGPCLSSTQCRQRICIYKGGSYKLYYTVCLKTYFFSVEQSCQSQQVPKHEKSDSSSINTLLINLSSQTSVPIILPNQVSFYQPKPHYINPSNSRLGLQQPNHSAGEEKLLPSLEKTGKTC
jgi:hypothetical protein